MRSSVAAIRLASIALGVLACSSNGTSSLPADGGGVHTPDGASGGAASARGGAGTAGAMHAGTTDAGTGAGGAGGSESGETPETGIPQMDAARPNADAGVETRRTVGFHVGVNGLITDTIANLAPIGNVREYHNWGWLGNNYTDNPYPKTLYTPNIPDFNWDWDALFSGLQNMGVSGFPAVQGAAPWVNNGALPPAEGAPASAKSYLAHGDTMFQIAARWGKVKVPDAELELEPGQKRVSGLGTVAYFEDFNEQDNVKGFTGDVFAAMASADYDGDQKRLGTRIGVKNADPDAELVMGGLSGTYGGGTTWIDSITKFLDAARAWSATNRGGSFPADVVNVHYYSFGKGAPAPALSPEDDGVQSKLAAVVAYRDQKLPGKPVWWTEFGYDTSANSPLHAPALGQNDAFVVQGQWLVRALLAGIAAGVERATLFELDDTCTPPETACDTQFATSGLMTHPDSKPKPAWFFVATFRARLATMAFERELTSSAPDVKVFQFAETAGAGGALVVWAPTSKATVHSGYSLKLPSDATSVTSVALVDQHQNGVETPLTPAGGAVTLDVSETPTVVIYR